MGLFSSKYVTQVGTTAQRLVEDKQLPNAVKTGVFAAIMGEANAKDNGVADFVMEELFRSIGIRADNLYTWAKKSYIYGLPSGQYRTTRTLRATVEARLPALVGGAPVIDYCEVGPPNDLHSGWVQLVRDHGYDPTTNRIASLEATKGKPVYLDDMVMHVADTTLSNRTSVSLQQWGNPPRSGVTPLRTASAGKLYTFSPPVLDPVATADYVRVYYVWETQAAGQPVVLAREHFDINLSEWLDSEDYIQVRYLKGSAVSYWTYRVGSGDTELDKVTGTTHDEERGSFFPFLYFRFNKQSQSSDRAARAYKDSKKFARQLGLNFDDITDAINNNPDIADVEQAMLMFAVPSVSTDRVECRYLFDFFSGLYNGSGTAELADPTTEDMLRRLAKGPGNRESAIVIEDKRFKMVLSNEGIYRRLVAGSIGPMGTFKSEFDQANNLHHYSKQLSETTYEQISVRFLKFTYFIFGEHTALTDGVDDVLLIPVDRTISNKMSLADRERLYVKSLHLVFNSRVVTKVKWYQRGWFRDFLLVLAIVITISSGGADGGSLIAAVLAGNTALIIQLGWVLLQRILIRMLVAQVIKFFVKEFGLDAAFLLAVVNMVAFQSFDEGALVLPDITDMLAATQAVLTAATELTQEKLLKLYEEAAEFSKWVEAQTKLVEDAQSLLDTTSSINPHTLFGESPDDFYNRTVHAGNIGALGFGAISSYVDTALKLPTLDDTLGELQYEDEVPQ